MRTIHRAVAVPCSLFVFLLFAFPNYCDRCSYRDIKDAIKVAAAEVPSRLNGVPPCCAGVEGPAEPAPEGNPGREAGGGPPSKNLDHARVPYCIGSTLSTVTSHSDALVEIRRTVTPELFRALETAFARLSPVLDHKESRAPPA